MILGCILFPFVAVDGDTDGKESRNEERASTRQGHDGGCSGGDERKSHDFPFVLYGEGCPAILFMAGTFVSGYSALLASVETDQNHYDQCDCRDDVCVADIFSSSI